MIRSREEMGRRGEIKAVEYLQSKGYHILDRNLRIRGGEIDIIARRGRDIVFVEVKTRSSAVYGFPEESVGRKKRQHIQRAINEYVRRMRVDQHFALRFDIISLLSRQEGHDFEIRHIENIELQ